MCPLSPDSSDGIAWLNCRTLRCGGATIAAELWVGGRRYRVIIRPLSLDNTGGVSRGEALVPRNLLISSGAASNYLKASRYSPWVIDAGNNVTSDSAVCRGSHCEKGNRSEDRVEQHDEFLKRRYPVKYKETRG